MIAALDRELQAIQDDIAANPTGRLRKGWTNRAILRWVQAKLVTDTRRRRTMAQRSDQGKLAELFAHLTSERSRRCTRPSPRPASVPTRSSPS